MAGRPKAGKTRSRGSIDVLPSGALRVRVYAGVDPVTKKRHDLIEVVPPGLKAWKTAEQIRDRFLVDIAERRNPRTSATVDQLLTRYLDQFDGAPNTLMLYVGYVRKHISPLLGHLKIGELDADVLDSFYAELRRCGDHCTGRRRFQHRTERSHECDDRCGPHRCRPLGPTTVRHMHFLLSGAYSRAVRWRWVAVNPVSQATPPAAPKPNPEPPSPAEAARIITAAWEDPDWGALIWTAMTTGARRGELCAIRWSSVSFEEGRETVWLRQAIRKEHDELVESDLKTHQQRRVALDPKTVEVLREHRERADARTRLLGVDLDADAFVFSSAPDSSTFLRPDGVTQRYERLADRLGINTTFHKLRHYSATELIAGGVDPRTVAGRLGHGGGGTTTLRTYTAWVSEADQRAACGLGAGMPARPPRVEPVERTRREPRFPYQVVAAAVADRIDRGEIRPGTVLPSAADLATEYGISTSTAKRAITQLAEWKLVGRAGRMPLRVRSHAMEEAVTTAPTRSAPAEGIALLDFVVRRAGEATATFSAEANPADGADLRQVLVDAIRRQGGDIDQLGEYELDVRRAGQRDILRTFAASARSRQPP